MNLTQKETAEKAGIDRVTLRRIEQGKVIPTVETLEALSPILKEDLISTLLQYRFDDYTVLVRIINRLETKLDNLDLSDIEIEISALSYLRNSTLNEYYRNIIDQITALVDALNSFDSKDYNTALEKLIMGIKITSPEFELNSFRSFVYSYMEMRILMNISFVLYELDRFDEYYAIAKFLVKTSEPTSNLYPKLCHNLARAYIRNNEYEKSLIYSTKGIESSQKNRNFTTLALLYFGKGLAQAHLNLSDYKDSLETSIYLCKAFGQIVLKEKIIAKCNKYIDADLSFLNEI